MPARRLPNDVHRRKGSLRADRHHVPEIPEGDGVGEPPHHLSAEAGEVWNDLAAEAYWLRPVDRAALEVAALAMLRLRRAIPTAAETSAASKALAALGLSPAARGQVAGLSPTRPDPKPDDPLAEFTVARAR
jgi:phage terminase small subunit